MTGLDFAEIEKIMLVEFERVSTMARKKSGADVPCTLLVITGKSFNPAKWRFIACIFDAFPPDALAEVFASLGARLAMDGYNVLAVVWVTEAWRVQRDVRLPRPPRGSFKFIPGREEVLIVSAATIDQKTKVLECILGRDAEGFRTFGELEPVVMDEEPDINMLEDFFNAYAIAFKAQRASPLN